MAELGGAERLHPIFRLHTADTFYADDFCKKFLLFALDLRPILCRKFLILDLCPIFAVRDRQMSHRRIFAFHLHDLPPAHNKAIARPEGVSQSQFASNIVTLKKDRI